MLVAGLVYIASNAAGEFHHRAIAQDGDAWCGGYNGHGRLGDGEAH